MRNDKRRNVSTHARVSFSRSKMSSPMRGGGGGVKFWAPTVGRINRKDPSFILLTFPKNVNVFKRVVKYHQFTLVIAFQRRFRFRQGMVFRFCLDLDFATYLSCIQGGNRGLFWLLTFPKNVSLFKWVWQLSLLSYWKVFYARNCIRGFQSALLLEQKTTLAVTVVFYF